MREGREVERTRGSWQQFLAACAVVAILAPQVASAQVFVYPRRPNKSQVRYYDFEWKHVDILVGPDADTSRAHDFDTGLREPPSTPTPVSPSPSGAPHLPPGEEGPGDSPQSPTPVPPPSEEEGSGGGFPLWDPIAGQTGESGAPDAGVAAAAADAGTSGGAVAGGSAGPDAGMEAAATQAAQQGTTDGGVDDGEARVSGGQIAATGEGAGAEVPFFERTLPLAGDPKKLLGAKSGGVRLFFYERERDVAERAAAIIVDSYVYLVGQFNYVPTQTFPYVLYSSYQEFLQTNLFPLQEGTLGVTSPVDLKLTLPYFGDNKLFAEVSAHEMAHQFTIQKVRSATEKAEIWGEPLSAIPLWFIEGIAEYYAKRGIDPEAEMLVRDLVVNPDFELGYVLLDFYEDRPWSFLWTYKLGQVRAAFLEETYGRGTLQRVLELSPRLVGEVGGAPTIDGFQSLLEHITRDEAKQLAAKFETWLKRRAYRTYLASAQSTPAVELIPGFEDSFIDALQASPSGNLMAIRSMDMNTGRSRLQLLDPRAPDDDVLIAVDGVPGVESLHPVFGRNFDVSENQIVFVAEQGGSDVLYVQPIEHAARKLSAEEVAREIRPDTPIGHPPVAPTIAEQKELWEVDLDVGARQTFDLSRFGLIAAYAPEFSPDGRQIAFIGFDFSGTRDIYLLNPDPAAEGGYQLTRLTEDAYTERQLAWGPDGIVFNSDATSHGHFNLFRVRPDAPMKVERLTTEARDHLDPAATPDGRVMFSAYHRGRADIHEYAEGTVFRRTDITTGLFDLAPGPNGSLWALYHQAGRRRPVKVPKRNLLTLETLPQPPPEPPRPLAERPLADAVAYEALAPRNWELGPPFGFIGGGTGGIWGQVVASASDKLRNHALLLNIAVLGSFDLTDGYLVYLNQEGRMSWGTGLFQSLVFRIDPSLEDVAPGLFFVSTERFYGVLGSLRYPFNQFVYLQGDLSVGGVTYFLTRPERVFLQDPILNGTETDLYPTWRERNEGSRFQTEVTARFGYDTIRYAAGTGPIAGSSLLLEASTAFQPFQREMFGSLRLDAERYFPIYGRANFFLRTGVGTTFGGRLARQFALSTFDTLRGIPYGQLDWTIGRHFLFSTAELQVPLNSIIRVLILTDIEAIAGVDFGGVGRTPEDVWRRRVLAPVVGFNFGLGPLVLRLHFAKPIDIGAPANLPSPNGEWVTNFSIRILGFEGLFSQKGDRRRSSLYEVRRQTLMTGPRQPL